MQETGRVAGSFRDPSGFVYRDAGGVLLRQVNEVYGPIYERLMASGLYARLVEKGMLVPHEEVDPTLARAPGAARILAPEPVPFISYPYEWCAGQLRDAALLTLDIQRTALECGMTLKDASAYNIQFRGARPVLIDTLSFEDYVEGQPWIAYGQFCRHFLAPLALMRYGEPDMARLQRGFIDGIPLPVAARALPWRSRLRPGLLMHLHGLAAAERRQVRDRDAAPSRAATVKVSRAGLLGIVESLRATVAALGPSSGATVWGDYYGHTNYSEAGAQSKETIVCDFLARARPVTVWDLGANTGRYSVLAARRASVTVAMDLDHGAVEALYQRERSEAAGILPLVMDLSNPSPAQGWAHGERMSLADRGPADCALALALIHHLCIGNNVPLGHVAAFLAGACRRLIIEFVPKEDSMVQRMLATREDVFPDYTQESFETAFAAWFQVDAREPVADTARVLYLMRRRET